MRQVLLFRIIAFIIILSGSLIPAMAQLKTDSKTMERLLSDAGERGIRINNNREIDLSAICPGKKANVRMQDSILMDMGIILFHKDMDRSYIAPVYDFIERFFLSLLVKKSKAEQLYLLREDFVTLKVNGKDFASSRQTVPLILQLIQPGSPFTLSSDSSGFRAAWLIDNGNTEIELTFPKQYDLILGKDKKELVRSFKTALSEFTYASQPETINPDLFKPVAGRNIYESIRDTYVIPQVRTGEYIYKKGNTYAYLFNERMGQESLLNAFIHADNMDNKNSVQLSLKGYQFSETFLCPLAKLCAYMKHHGCVGYMGLETENSEEFTGTVFYVNRDLMYKHLLYFTFPKEAFKNPQIPIVTTIYPYIPINNIENLYEDVHPGTGK